MRTLVVFAMLLVCLFLPAIQAAPASSAPRASSAASTPRALSDAQIDQDLRARLARSKLASKRFTFKIQGGVATLEGKTDVIQHKGIMTRMAKAAGARAVVNHIEISEAARQKAAARLESGRRRALVKQQAAAK